MVKLKKTNNKACTFNDLVKNWKEYKSDELSPRTVDGYESMLNGHLVPRFSVWKLDEIRPLDIEGFLKFLRTDGARLDGKKGGYSDKSIEAYYMLLNVLFKMGVDLEMLERNIIDKVKKPTVTQKNAAFYNPSQITELLHCIDKEKEALEISLKRRNPNHRFLTEQRIREVIAERKYSYILHNAFIYMALSSAARRSEICGLN